MSSLEDVYSDPLPIFFSGFFDVELYVLFIVWVLTTYWSYYLQILLPIQGYLFVDYFLFLGVWRYI